MALHVTACELCHSVVRTARAVARMSGTPGWGLPFESVPEADRWALRGHGGEVPASSGAVSDHGCRPSRRHSSPVLLTLAVLCLVYQQVPPPFGANIVKNWLYYALPVLGGLLLAQFGRNVVKAAGSQLRRAARQAKKIIQGFDLSVTFDPNRAAGTDRDSDRLLDAEHSNNNQPTFATTSAPRRSADDDG